MATLLPTSELGHGLLPRSPNNASKSTTRTRSSKSTRATNRKEMELIERREDLRMEQPKLSKAETSTYRNSFRHNLCLDMLQEGSHRSFSEIFSLMTRQAEVREKAGPDSVLWNEILLKDQPKKLSTMKAALTQAEQALRDSDLLDATAQYEEYCQLAEKDRDWQLDTGVTFFKDACDHLTRIYTKLSQTCDGEEKLQYLLQAYTMARKGGEEKLVGVAAYKLGGAYTKIGDPKTALQYLHTYLDLCEDAKDDIGIGKACEAIAKALECEGSIAESVEFLERFVEVAERSQQEQAIGAACSSLGAIYNAKGDYVKATEYFNKAFKIARSKTDIKATSTSSVHYGIALAHGMMSNVGQHLMDPSKAAIGRLLNWKNQRVDDFKKPIPTDKDSQATNESQEQRPASGNH